MTYLRLQKGIWCYILINPVGIRLNNQDVKKLKQKANTKRTPMATMVRSELAKHIRENEKE